jgi:hypothetical protein
MLQPAFSNEFNQRRKTAVHRISKLALARCFCGVRLSSGSGSWSRY